MGLAFSIAGSSLSVTGSARSAIASAFFSALIPPMMNIEANIGRASLLTRTMPPSYPICPPRVSRISTGGVSGGEAVEVAREQRDFADVVGLDQPSRPALQSDGESTMRRDAVFEGVDVGGIRLQADGRGHAGRVRSRHTGEAAAHH